LRRRNLVVNVFAEQWDVLGEVTHDERYTGARLALADRIPEPRG
jgi:hypothetical protein